MSAAGSSPPSRARVVVIGGGIIGCSVAYHLAELGWDDARIQAEVAAFAEEAAAEGIVASAAPAA